MKIYSADKCVSYEQAVVSAVNIARCIDTAKRKLPTILAICEIKEVPEKCSLLVYEKIKGQKNFYGEYIL